MAEEKRKTPLKELIDTLVNPIKEEYEPEFIKLHFWATASPLGRVTIIGKGDLKKVHSVNRSTTRMYRMANPINTITPMTLLHLRQNDLRTEWNLRASLEGRLIDLLATEKKHMIVEDAERIPKKEGIMSRITNKIRGG